jgi:uncharacterized integral membrane protein
MPWRLITAIVIFVIFVLFMMVNLENRCNISFGFKVFEQIPVFITIFFSFIVGLLCALPLAFIMKRKSKGTVAKGKDKESRLKLEDTPAPKPNDGEVSDAN